RPFDEPSPTEEHAARVLDAELPDTLDTNLSESDAPLEGHVVLLGHGGVGGVLTRFLRQREIPFVVIEQDYQEVLSLRRQGVRVLHGHGEDPELLARAGVPNARMLLVTTTQPVAARRAIEQAHRSNSRLRVIARV